MTNIICFGSTGHLFRTKFLVGFSLVSKEILHSEIKIVAVGRKNYDSNTYRDYVYSNISNMQNIHLEKLFYEKIDFFDEESYKKLRKYLNNNKFNVIYIALTPNILFTVLENLIKLNLVTLNTKIITEKPFGGNLVEAQSLISILNKNKLIDKVFILDHYLFKQSVISFDEFLKNSIDELKMFSYIEEIIVIISEEDILESRYDFFNSTGIIADMFQSHGLELLKLFIRPIEGYKMDDKSIIKNIVPTINTYSGNFFSQNNKIIKPTMITSFLYYKGIKISMLIGKGMKEKKTEIIAKGRKIMDIKLNIYPYKFLQIGDDRKILLSKTQNNHEYSLIILDYFKNIFHKLITPEISVESWLLSDKIEAISMKNPKILYDIKTSIKELSLINQSI